MAACFGGSSSSDGEGDGHAATYYSLTATGGILDDRRGREVLQYLRQVVASNYKNCFKSWPKQKKSHFNEVIRAMHATYPNPKHSRFDEVWAKRKVGEILANKKPPLIRQARVKKHRLDRGEPGHGIPGSAHAREWEEAMERARAGGSARHQRARRIQMERYGSSHYGSGGVASWQAEFVSIVNHVC